MSFVTIAAHTTHITGYHGASAALWLAIFAEKDFITESGESVVSGSPNFGNDFYRKVAVTIDGEGLVSIPAINIESTEDADPYATLTAYFLDQNLSLIRPFHKSFRIPVQPAATTWKKLMEHLAIPQIIIDPSVTRTERMLQEWSAAHGVVDSIIRRTGSTLAVAGNQTISGTQAVTGAQTVASLDVGSDASIGRDALVERDVVAERDIYGRNLFGNIDGTTGGTSDNLTGNKWHGPGSLMTQVDDDGDGDGEYKIRVGDDVTGVDALIVRPDSSVEVNSVLSGYIRDKGGRCVDVKAFGAKGNDIDDDTAAIEAAKAALYAMGNGTLFFPPGVYRTTGGHQLTGGITVEGVGGSSPGLAFGLTNTSMSVLHLTAENARVFQIMPRAVAVKIHDLSGNADSETGTQFIYAEGQNPGVGDPASTSFGHLFERLWTTGFRAGIEVQAAPGTSWQFDRWTARNCAFIDRYGILINSQDCDQVLIANCQLGLVAGMSYGFYGERCGTVTLDTCYSVGNLGANGRAFLFFTSQRDNVVVRNCWTEQSDYFLELEESASGARGVPILLGGNGITDIYLGHSASIISLGNAYYSAGCVTAGPDANDNIINSFGDVVLEFSGGDIGRMDASPFDLPADSNRINELGYLGNVLDARIHGLRIRGHVGVGEFAAVSDDAILQIRPSGAESSNSKPLMRLSNDDGSVYLDLIRDPANGNFRFVCNQGGGFSGFQFEGSRMGFYGVAAIARQSIAAAATDAGSTQALANSIRTILLNLGLAQ